MPFASAAVIHGTRSVPYENSLAATRVCGTMTLMPNYVRAIEAGGTFFFTVVTNRRRPILVSDLARSLLRGAIDDTRRRFPFTIEAFVLLPDHLHTIWRLPDEDSDYSKRWALIKKQFSQQWIAAGGQVSSVTNAQQRAGRVGVWQPRFWEHVVRATDFANIVEYIHLNPVKHGHARCPHEWPWSSFHRWVREGRSRADCCCVCAGQCETPTFPESYDHFE